jgi:hypothetical protein
MIPVAIGFAAWWKYSQRPQTIDSRRAERDSMMSEGFLSKLKVGARIFGTVTALISAFCWFRSASISIPPHVGFDVFAENYDWLTKTLLRETVWNTAAAIFAGLTAIAAALDSIIQLARKLPKANV